MASVIQRADAWYAKFRDADGRPRRIRVSALTRAEAKRMAEDLERQAERRSLNLEPIMPRDGGGTVMGLLEWWLETYVRGTPSEARTPHMTRLHFSGSELAGMRLADVRKGHVEMFLQAKLDTLAPQTVNHLRQFLVSAFKRAIEADRWPGDNPAKHTRPRKVVQTSAPDYLRAHEVGPLLKALDLRWRPLFATALYTGLRKGELLALRKSDVDLHQRLITVARTNTRDSTKSGRVSTVDIPAELVPYLELAVARSSDLLFPGEDGEPMRPDVKLHHVLRRAMARAGLASDFRHVCRRPGCREVVEADTADLQRCPKDGAKLWPKPVVRPLKFHHLRHTTGSLLVMAGASMAYVSRQLRHADIRITNEVYTHLSPTFRLAEADRLKLGADTPELLEPLRAAVNATRLGPYGVQASRTKNEGPEIGPVSRATPGPSGERRKGFEPSTPSLGSSCSTN